jgi:RND family efflux transporter MFP subunit
MGHYLFIQSLKLRTFVIICNCFAKVASSQVRVVTLVKLKPTNMKKALLLSICVLLFACQDKNMDEQEIAQANIKTSNIENPPIEIQTTPVQVGQFPLRILTNGTVQAQQKVELKLETSGKIVQLPIQVGNRVKKGQLIVQLDDQAQQLQLTQANIQLEETNVNKADLLIANGGEAFQDTSVTAEKLKLVNTLSGYDKAQHNIRQAKYELQQTKLFAPFAGIVADVKVKQYQQANAGETVCTLLNPSSFEVKFTLLEEQALAIKKGQTVKIEPLSSQNTLTGRIAAINPIVSEQGLVTIYARLLSTRVSLFEGMNVKVIIEDRVPNQLIIPKSAVVLRSEKPVVFTYSAEEQLAKWNYVTVAHENDSLVAISEGLEQEMLVIYEGNLNLDHDARVVVKNDIE